MSVMPVAIVESWLRCSGSDAEPLRFFCSAAGDVVVEQRAWCVSPDSLTVREQLATLLFHVRDGRVVDHERYDELAEALRAACATADDEVLG